MCTTTVVVRVHADGRRSTVPEQTYLCVASRYGRPCADHIEVQSSSATHDKLPAAPAAPIIVAPTTSFPPTPEYSPRPSSRSSAAAAAAAAALDAGSDGSRHSSRHSSTSSSRRRHRSPGIYVNGQRVVNVHSSSSSGRERILLVSNPPTPRTPPLGHHMPRSAPPSPSANLSVPHGGGSSSSSPRESYNRPYLVDERPSRAHQLPVHYPPSPVSSSSSRHSRQASTSSQGSNNSSSRNSHGRHSASSLSAVAAAAAADEEEERRRRRRRREERDEERISHRTQNLRDRIDMANDEISNRPGSRSAAAEQQQQQQQQPVAERRSRRDTFDEVPVAAMGRLTVQDKNWKERRAHQRGLELEKEEQEEQDRRLRERMVPSRRATVGPGSRRHRVAYDDGLYRWE
ncbi:hypothetical protein V2A60_007166 [Cordyceps javanica]